MVVGLRFLWGTATSAHQVEGNNAGSDWWDYEQRGLLREPSGLACDFWNRWQSDIDLMVELGYNAFRYSVEWARVEPVEGEFAEDVLNRYLEMTLYMRERGIEPVVTLHHFTNPHWFLQKGGWELEGNIHCFERFVSKVAAMLTPHVRFWVTINEPMVYGFGGYANGMWPPMKKDFGLAKVVIGSLLRAHAKAYQLLHDARSDVLVSIAKHVRLIEPSRSWHPGDRLAARLQDYYANAAVLDALHTGVYLKQVIPGLKGSWDYIGLNYYTRGQVQFAWNRLSGFGQDVSPTGEVNALGWEVYPQGLYQVLQRLKAFSKPVIITENGICAREDEQRVRYLDTHLKAVMDAIQSGVDVQGYLYWSFMDNFEWAEGFEPRFGLVDVDYYTQERKPRPSAWHFSELGKRFGTLSHQTGTDEHSL